MQAPPSLENGHGPDRAGCAAPDLQRQADEAEAAAPHDALEVGQACSVDLDQAGGIQSGLPGAALTISGSASASAPKTGTGT